MRELTDLQAWTKERTVEAGFSSDIVTSLDIFGGSRYNVLGSSVGSKADVAGVYGRLGLHRGDRVRIVGASDPNLVAELPSALGVQPCTDVTQADVVLFWPNSEETLDTELSKLHDQLRPASQVWVITAHPGKKGNAGDAIPQGAILAAARKNGLRDNRVAAINEREYGYRFRAA